MDGLFFLLSILAIGLVMRWTVMNDKVAPDKPTSGLFAMKMLAGRRKRRSGLLSPPPQATDLGAAAATKAAQQSQARRRPP